MADEPAPARRASGRTLLLGAGLTVAVLLAAGVVATTGGDDATGERPDAAEPRQERLADRVEPTEATPLPAVDLAGFHDDEPVALDGYRGHPLVLNFWGTWCRPCVEEMPELQAVAQATDELAVLGVNVEDQHDEAVALVASLDITYDLAIDEDSRLFGEVEAFGMPTTLLVDPDGVIRYRHTGQLDADQLEALLDEHLDVDI